MMSRKTNAAAPRNKMLAAMPSRQVIGVPGEGGGGATGGVLATGGSLAFMARLKTSGFVEVVRRFAESSKNIWD